MRRSATIAQVFDMPWAAVNEGRRLLALPYIRLFFWFHGVPWGKGWRVFGAPRVQRHRGSRIELGDGLELRSWPGSNPLSPKQRSVLATRSAGARITIGQDCALTGVVLVARDAIVLGDRVTVGANTTIVDTDFHPLDPAVRRQNFNGGTHRPIHIEDDVFIGMNVIVLKGVTIGRGSVVGAGAVVSSNVPRGAVVAGNPARQLG